MITDDLMIMFVWTVVNSQGIRGFRKSSYNTADTLFIMVDIVLKKEKDR